MSDEKVITLTPKMMKEHRAKRAEKAVVEPTLAERLCFYPREPSSHHISVTVWDGTDYQRCFIEACILAGIGLKSVNEYDFASCVQEIKDFGSSLARGRTFFYMNIDTRGME